ncbi:transglycosylase SLT domain-containing protein [Dyella sp.]|uniref:transglycosylase SLT domain-containing protein n=1 Tax=Dyella sp. TaxID=1869338 RepID=UPI002ED0849F
MSELVKPRRFHRLILLAAGWLLTAASLHADEPSQAQRDAFRQAYATAQQGGDGWRAQAQGLSGYPLYPYLEAAALTHDLRQLDRAAVESYLSRYPDMIPASDLRRDFLLELARRKDWDNFLALYQPGINDTLTCDALQARLAKGGKLDFDKDLTALWAKPSLPASACDPVLGEAFSQGLLTSARLWERIDRAADANQPGTIATLANWLPANEQQAGQRLATALRDPASAVNAAATWPDTPRHRQAAMLALQRLARRQSTTADQAWQKLQHHFNFSPAQRGRILNALAVFHATDFDESALDRLAALPADAQTDASREWRVRVALSQQNWNAALAGIAAMTATQRDDGEWRWFKARALEGLNRHDEALRVLQPLSRESTFFGFMAADRLDTGYAICPQTLPANAQREQSLMANAGIQRAFELYFVGLPKLARREWSRALDGADADTLRQAVDLAYRRGWYDRAVFALNSGEALRYYEQRFPLAGQDGLVPQAQQAGIDPAWAYGILRAESAWMSDARSAADARGLMQLLPGTAANVAKRNGLPWSGGDSLYDPVVNVQLGTRYLAQMAARFNGAPWLASAAYNAGPARVDQWLAARGSLAPDLFTATMPFKETREYVARVMAFAVIYDWRMNGTAVPLSDRMTAIGSAYQLPGSQTRRRVVGCPVAATPAKAESNGAPAANEMPPSATSAQPAPAATSP